MPINVQGTALSIALKSNVNKLCNFKSANYFELPLFVFL
jgi:hypothetical protein